MSTSLESFVNVLRRSGLVEEPALVECVNALRQSGQPVTGESLSELLVQQGRITPWQAAKLIQGKHKGFFLGKYKLLRLLGKGGMSSVYLAEHVLMKRRCAIKVLPWKLVKDSSYLQRFHREAQAVAALDHPNIVRAYDIDLEKDGNLEIHFLVMEFVEGKNLFDLVQQVGPLPPAVAAEYMRQGALGLQHAHSVGMVHRDVKPGNFIVDQNGVVKLMDLGLARVAAQEDHSLTIAHDERVLGTADYLAPEQAVDSHLVDHRADIYSLGCTLYFLLTGRPPFNEGTLTQRLLAHQTKEPPPAQSLRGDLPESLLVVLRKMMIKDREKRIQTSADVATLLGQWLAGETIDETADSLPVAALTRTENETYEQGYASGEPGTLLQGDEAPPASSNPLGAFLSSLSDLDATRRELPADSRPMRDSATMRLEQSETDDPDQPLEPYPDHFDVPSEDEDNPFESPRSSSLIRGRSEKSPSRPSAKSSGSLSARSGKKTGRKKSPLEVLRSILPPKLMEQVEKKPIPFAAGAAGVVVLLVIVGIFALSGSGKSKKPPQPAPKGTAATGTVSPPARTDGGGDAPPAAPEIKRPEVSGTVISVGPKGNFAALQQAVDYLKNNSSTSTVAMGIKEIQIDGDLILKESLRIDNSGLGGFPRGIKISSAGDTPARLQPEGKDTVVFLDSVEGLILENLVINSQGHRTGLVLRGYSYGTQLINLKLENVQNIGIEGAGASGLPGQPILIRDCVIRGSASSAKGIHLDSTSGYDCRAMTIQQCRFVGPMGTGIAIDGSIESLELVLNRFYDAATALLFSGSDSIYRNVRIVNNSFVGGGTALRFSDVTSPSSSGLVLENNLFVRQSDKASSFFGDSDQLQQLTKGGQVRFNWTDGNPAGGTEEQLFAQNGVSTKAVEFESEDSASSEFLKPKTAEIRNAGAPGPHKFFGAVSP